MKKSGNQTRKKSARIPEIERFGPYKWVPIQTVEAPHGVRYPHHWERLFKSFHRHKGWHGRPLLVERVPAGRRPGIRYVAWTGSHRLAAAFAARVWEVPVIEIHGKLWDEVHGRAEKSRMSETYEDQDRLAMLLVTRDHRAIALMDREVPKTRAQKKARKARRARKESGPPWSPLGEGGRLEARVSEDVVEVRHKRSGEVHGFGREVLERLLALFPQERKKRPTREAGEAVGRLQQQCAQGAPRKVA